MLDIGDGRVMETYPYMIPTVLSSIRPRYHTTQKALASPEQAEWRMRSEKGSAMELMGKSDDGTKDKVGILFERSDCTADHFRSTSCPTIFLPQFISWEVYEL